MQYKRATELIPVLAVLLLEGPSHQVLPEGPLTLPLQAELSPEVKRQAVNVARKAAVANAKEAAEVLSQVGELLRRPPEGQAS